MGYREDIVLAISAPGWHRFQIVKAALTQDKNNELTQLLSDADQHWENPDEDHLFLWESIKTGCDDFQTLMNILQGDISLPDWYMISLGEDGAEEFYGEWFDSPFNLSTTRSLNYNADGCAVVASVKPTPIPTTQPAASIPINNHKCIQCGNTACNKSEKSCWKCGCPI